VRGTWSYDLDVGAETSAPNRADFWWDQVDAVKRMIVPKNSAQFNVLGIRDFGSLGYADLKGLSYSSQPIDGSNQTFNHIPQGTVVAYRTKEGRFGKFRVDQYGYNLNIEWVTFAK